MTDVLAWLVVLVLQDCVCAGYYLSTAGSANITGCPTVYSPHTHRATTTAKNEWLPLVTGGQAGLGVGEVLTGLET